MMVDWKTGTSLSSRYFALVVATSAASSVDSNKVSSKIWMLSALNPLLFAVCSPLPRLFSHSRMTE